jgi:hypothetical protein
MLDAIMTMRDHYIEVNGYPPTFLNLTQDQKDELKGELSDCASGMCSTHKPNEVMGMEIRVAA